MALAPRFSVLVTSLFVAAVVAASVSQGSAQNAGRVPQAVFQNAGTNPLLVAGSLVDAAIPTGLEIKSHDRVALSNRAVKVNWTDAVPLDQFVARFNTAHQDYIASHTTRGGMLGIVIRPRAGRVAFLDAQSSVTARTVTGVPNAINIVCAPSAIRPSSVGGAAGIIPSSPGVTPPMGSSSMDDILGTRREIRISRGRMTHADVLNDIVSQANGEQGWIVTGTEAANGQMVPSQCGTILRGGLVLEASVPQ